ncbi:hypothetical protein [Microbacterium sp. CIAB417]|uniref:hypothetical protein n=1 Tax=Microbacterium sp. CIAB417 TaxID=2860287 RepID=UPI001FAC8355|nr:hypothetical protein [Microbacterium sp. CIAB417]
MTEDRAVTVPLRVRVARVLVIVALSIAVLSLIVALQTTLTAGAWPHETRALPGLLGGVLPALAIATMMLAVVGAVLVLPPPRHLRVLLPVLIAVALAILTIWVVAASPVFAPLDCGASC